MTSSTRNKVKISLQLPVDRVETHRNFAEANGIRLIAQSAESLGFHAVYVTDHPAPDQRWLNQGGHHSLEPTVALTAAAVVTTKIFLHTNIYVLSYRNPFLAAKSLASLDVISGGRLIAGVAAGYLKPEFNALGKSFEDRAQRFEESLKILPRIWSESSLQAAGTDWSARSVTALPQPSTQPHPPLWIGGNSTAAMQRAILYGNGWSPFPTPPDAESYLRTDSIPDVETLASKLAEFRERSLEHGRNERLTTCFVPWSQSAYLQNAEMTRTRIAEEIFELAELGIDWVAVGCPGETPEAVTKEAELLANVLHLG